MAVLVAGAATYVVFAALAIGFSRGKQAYRLLRYNLTPGLVVIFAIATAVAVAGVWLARRTGGGGLRVVDAAVLPLTVMVVVFLRLP